MSTPQSEQPKAILTDSELLNLVERFHLTVGRSGYRGSITNYAKLLRDWTIDGKPAGKLEGEAQ